MACIGDESWKFSYNSAIIDFIINDDNEQDKRTDAPRLKPLPHKTISEDLMDFLASEELCTKTPTSVTFKSIEDPLPSYEGNFATLTNDYEQKTVTNEQSRHLATLRAPLRAPKVEKKPFSPSDVLNKPITIKQEKMESDPILNFNSLRDCLPAKENIKKERQELNIDQFFKKENSMSISVNDMSSMVEEGSGFLDGFSPVSPASSEGSTDTLLSSGASDLETSPRRGNASPLKKTRRRKVTEGGNCPHLWQFILELLGDKTHAQVISWTGVEFHFKVHNSRELARLWGSRKNKPRMNFDKLSRAMRYYYDKNIIKHISGQRLVYEFCRNNEDTVYSKLLKVAAQTMPQKPLVSLSTAAKPSYSPPSYSSYMAQEPAVQHPTTKCSFSTPAQLYRAETSAPPPAPGPGSYPSYAAMYNTALYNSTGRYLNDQLSSNTTRSTAEYFDHVTPAATPAEQQQQQQIQQPPSYIPNYTYNQAALNINVQVGGGYNKERLGYSYSHYTPY